MLTPANYFTAFVFVITTSTVISDDFPYPKDAPTKVENCRDVIFSCDCGNPGYKFQAVFPQCHYWMPPEMACVRFTHCLECENGHDRCITCPQGRYGRWCNGRCNCKNGGTCNTKDGTCICPEGYEGENCQTRKVLLAGELNCDTKAATILQKPNILLRVTCPSGCQNRGGDIWGSSIYTDDSTICKAAIHSGILSDNGGTTFVVNNGHYSSFISSSLNSIQSKEKSTEMGSFRFTTPVPKDENGKKGCPPKWHSSNNLCVLPAKPETAWMIASGRC